ncbi:MAG: serine/threonine-protein kinase [Parachlamydiales bacterium]|nr:serine/threonine-protein kinase [Candidatus Acheromyda pituitae]
MSLKVNVHPFTETTYQSNSAFSSPSTFSSESTSCSETTYQSNSAFSSDPTITSQNTTIKKNLEWKLSKTLYNIFSSSSEFSAGIDCDVLAKKIAEFAGNQATQKSESAYKWVIFKDDLSASLHYYLQTDECLGKGTYGEVYRGFTSEGAPCAIKIGRIYQDEILSLFELSTRHSYQSNICQILAANHEEDILVMELAHADLRHAKPSLTEKEIRILFRGILSGINEMVSKQITHSDLKPANIFLMKRDDYFSAKIGDFGLAIKNLGKFNAGTRWYYSPEIYRSLSLHEKLLSDQVPKIDIWAAMMVFAEVGYNMMSLEFQDRFQAYTHTLKWEMENTASKKEFLFNMAADFKRGKYSHSDGLFSELKAQTPMDSLVQAMAMIDPEKRISAQEALNLFDGLFTSRPPSSPDLDISDELSSEDLISGSDF